MHSAYNPSFSVNPAREVFYLLFQSFEEGGPCIRADRMPLVAGHSGSPLSRLNGACFMLSHRRALATVADSRVDVTDLPHWL